MQLTINRKENNYSKMPDMEVDERIVKFLKRHHVMTLATATADGEPYCANAFYAYDTENNRLVFT